MGSLYVSNLPQAFDENEFRQLFVHFGDVERIDIPDRHGATNLIAYVHFQDPNSCNTAIAALNGKSFGGKKLKIEISNKQKRMHQPIQRNMLPTPEPAPYNIRPRPPSSHYNKGSLLPFQDAEKYVSLSCKMLPVHNGIIDGPNPQMPLSVSVTSFEREGNTYSLATPILVNKQPTDALVFLLPLPKKGEVPEFQQNYMGMPPQYPPPNPGYPPHPQGPPSQYPYPNNTYQPPYPPYGAPPYPNNGVPLPPADGMPPMGYAPPPPPPVAGMPYGGPHDRSPPPMGEMDPLM
ncbi:hypothetical protein TVAG_206220 [Trichomonas vaginalis G3]|uniref:RRM domain-containing protein n=1 Tax=Trichomonas vaginalis (strain ATCC PRA-98 / G3) TaxID=412133 RepID=A2E1K7_TRIV3|nr:RNA-binding domain, RBD family-containing protein [Trichomonas vaginalis G3]EAY13454.1 hypothetical protein TVAG_206220 [Trichomonas vaginalis G3]KAI5518351.1 RNA-binding domain, RBD family-containing protein [Trichomonas vaginalis G3]|eukprot:XP_001325677.1 hypothetical protein [Trichomonas vaginalis G3]